MKLDDIWETVIAVLLAAAGGFARLLNLKDKQVLKWTRIFSELFVSGFSGLMVLLVARASGLTGDWIGVIAGMSGWVGSRILDIVARIASGATGVDLSGKKIKYDGQDGAGARCALRLGAGSLGLGEGGGDYRWDESSG